MTGRPRATHADMEHSCAQRTNPRAVGTFADRHGGVACRVTVRLPCHRLIKPACAHLGQWGSA